MNYWTEKAVDMGWVIVPADHVPPDGAAEPHFYHAGLSRNWPLDDPKGAFMSALHNGKDPCDADDDPDEEVGCERCGSPATGERDGETLCADCCMEADSGDLYEY